MSFYRFSSLGNQLRSATQFHAFLPQGFHTNYRPSTDVIDANGNKMQAVRQVRDVLIFEKVLNALFRAGDA